MRALHTQWGQEPSPKPKTDNELVKRYERKAVSKGALCDETREKLQRAAAGRTTATNGVGVYGGGGGGGQAQALPTSWGQNALGNLSPQDRLQYYNQPEHKRHILDYAREQNLGIGYDQLGNITALYKSVMGHLQTIWRV